MNSIITDTNKTKDLQQTSTDTIVELLKLVCDLGNQGYSNFKVEHTYEIKVMAFISKIVVHCRRGDEWKFVGIKIYSDGVIDGMDKDGL